MAVAMWSPEIGAGTVITPAVQEALETDLWLEELANEVRVMHTTPLDQLELDCPAEELIDDLLAWYPAAPRPLAAC